MKNVLKTLVSGAAGDSSVVANFIHGLANNKGSCAILLTFWKLMAVVFVLGGLRLWLWYRKRSKQ